MRVELYLPCLPGRRQNAPRQPLALSRLYAAIATILLSPDIVRAGASEDCAAACG